MDSREGTAVNRKSMVPIVVFTLLALGLPARAAKDLVLTLQPPASTNFGKYSGEARIILGAVVDDGFTEGPHFLGMGPQAAYSVFLNQTREESVRAAVSHLLEEAGLVPDTPAEATHTMDVTIRRLRFFIHQTFGRFRLRSEVFLEFTFRQEDAVAGRVLACGNSQNHAQFASKKKVQATYQYGFDDALYKLVESETFSRILGDGWSSGSGSAEGGEYKIMRITRNRFYGPSDLIRTEIENARSAIEPDARRVLILQDFELKDEKYKTRKDADLELARRYLPELLREHLVFFPGAFDVVERRAEWEHAEGLVVTGDLLRFKIGSYMKRALIGFGAGKDKLEAMVQFRDGATGEELYRLDFKSSAWGAGWQMKRGQIRDMADQLARDLAFFLVEVGTTGYSYPEDLEVRFDDIPYPGGDDEVSDPES
jgi:hypothetical protein